MSFIKKEQLPQVVLPVVLILIFLLYLPALFNDFVMTWDDNSHVTENLAVRSLSPENIVRIFQSTVYDTYVPLTVLTYAVEYHFFGLNPVVYHVTNVLLHLAVTALIFLFLRQARFSLATAGIAALLFGIHPLHVESVAWISERKDVLYSVFFMLSLVGYQRYIHQKEKGWYVLALLFAAASILSKAMALSLPLILVLYDWFEGRSLSRKTILEKLPFLAVILPVTWLTYRLNARIPGDDFFAGILTWIWSFGFYIRQFFAPVTLLPYYALPQPVTLAQPDYLLAVAIGLAFVALVVFSGKTKVVRFSCLYFLLSIFYLLRVDDVYDTNIVSDRFMYLPSLGFCLLTAWAITKSLAWLKGKYPYEYRVAIVLLVILGGLLGGKTVWQTRIWKNDLTLWQGTVKHYPYTALPHYFYGQALLRAGAPQEAVTELTQAIELDPESELFLNDRGQAYLALQDYENAIKDFDLGIAKNPRRYEFYANRGAAYLQQNVLDKAFLDLETARQMRPENYEIYTLLSEFHRRNGEPEVARAALEEAAKRNPYALELRFARAEMRMNSGNLMGALEEYNEILAQNPRAYEVFVQRGNTYLKLGQSEAAVADYSKYLDKFQQEAGVYTNRGLAYLVRNQIDLALADFNQALQLTPRDIVALDNRAVIYLQTGQSGLAIADLNRSIELNPQNPISYFNRGLLFAESGQLDLAKFDFQQVLAIDGNFTAAQDQLGRIEQQQEQAPDAGGYRSILGDRQSKEQLWRSRENL